MLYFSDSNRENSNFLSFTISFLDGFKPTSIIWWSIVKFLWLQDLTFDGKLIEMDKKIKDSNPPSFLKKYFRNIWTYSITTKYKSNVKTSDHSRELTLKSALHWGKPQRQANKNQFQEIRGENGNWNNFPNPRRKTKNQFFKSTAQHQ